MQGSDDTSGADGGEPDLSGGTHVWVHPSEIGLRRRVRADRRRSKALAAGVMLAGVALLAAITHLPRRDSPPRRVESSASPMSVGVVGVEPLEPSGPMVTGLVIDAEGHVAVALEDIGSARQVRVHCAGTVNEATVVAADPDEDIAVLAVESPDEGTPLPAASVAKGDRLTLTSFSDDGRRWSRQVTVREVVGGDHLRVFSAEGAAAAHGVLSTTDGRVAGWVVRHDGTPGDTVAALSATSLLSSAEALLAGSSAPS